jgi:hypothetical protein
MPTFRKKPHLPAALVKNAAKAAAETHAEVLAAARDDMTLVREKMELVTDAFYDIGLALQRLAALAEPGPPYWKSIVLRRRALGEVA